MARTGLKEVTEEFKMCGHFFNERKRAYKWHLKRGGLPTEEQKCPALAEPRKKAEKEQKGQGSSS